MGAAAGVPRFCVLGRLELIDGSGVRPAGGPRQRALLAVLLLEGGRAVTRDRLIDELWGDDQVHCCLCSTTASTWPGAVCVVEREAVAAGMADRVPASRWPELLVLDVAAWQPREAWAGRPSAASCPEAGG